MQNLPVVVVVVVAVVVFCAITIGTKFKKII
jgi:hypothetical protein